MTASVRADYTALLWEQQEAAREAASTKADMTLLASFPHRSVAAPAVPGFCVCGWNLKAEIHT